MPTFTPNFGFSLPLVNNPIDEDIWGGEINGDFTSLDGLLTAIDTANIGATAPVIPTTAVSAAGMLWVNNSSGAGGVWPLQIYDGTAWLTIGMIDSTNHIFSGTGNIAINVQTFSTPGAFTYTPSFGMSYCIVEVLAGGGGGGGCIAAATSWSVGGGGGGGGYAKQIFTTSQIGASQALVIGAGGKAGMSPATPGGTGGNTSFGGAGALLNVSGGIGGTSAPGVSLANNPQATFGGSGGYSAVKLGFLNVTGSPGGNGLGFSSFAYGGTGGGTALGTLMQAPSFNSTIPGAAAGYLASNFGSGGTGGASYAPTFSNPLPGGVGGAGLIIITEFI
jgi:hypothetical protein